VPKEPFCAAAWPASELTTAKPLTSALAAARLAVAGPVARTTAPSTPPFAW